MDTIINWLILHLLWVYWVPFGLALLDFSIHIGEIIVSDTQRRSKPGGYYAPEATVGSLLGGLLLCLIPVMNIWVGVFCIWDRLTFVTEWLRKAFCIPLVPDTDKHRELRGVK